MYTRPVCLHFFTAMTSIWHVEKTIVKRSNRPAHPKNFSQIYSSNTPQARASRLVSTYVEKVSKGRRKTEKISRVHAAAAATAATNSALLYRQKSSDW